MVEASIVMPVIILIIILFLRVFVFYLQILETYLKCHETALNAGASYEGAVSLYRDQKSVTMLAGGVLTDDLEKDVRVRMYLIDEDAVVRAGDLVDTASGRK